MTTWGNCRVKGTTLYTKRVMVVLLGMILGDIALIVKIEMILIGLANMVQALMGYLLVWKLQLV